MLIKSYIKAIEYHLPETVEFNSFDDRLTQKIGIGERRIVQANEYASDLAMKAAQKLFASGICEESDIDFLLYCTQSPDYFLPTTACILQEKLGLSRSCGALDFNLGCSGYVYGLSLAKGLIESRLARNVLLITSDTYSKYTNPRDRSVRVLFGDASAATLVSNTESERDYIGPFVFGTDGSGAENLIVPAGGLREPATEKSMIEQTDSFGNSRSRVNLYMNGPEIFNFTLREVPKAVQLLLERASMGMEDYDYFVFHQANKHMLEHLRKKLMIDSTKFSICMNECGNTVSSTIPIALKHELENGCITAGFRIMLLGFGVGYSWAGCNIEWQPNINKKR